MEIQTRPLMTLEAYLDPPHLNAPTPLGVRKAVPVRGGIFHGERLNGIIEPLGGHDWALGRADGSLVLDVRLTLRTDDNAVILMSYRGIRTGPPEVLARMAAGERVDPAEYYFRIVPSFETDSPTYAWLNTIIAVGLGDRVPAGPVYTIFEVL
jgi:hypothetical protein